MTDNTLALLGGPKTVTAIPRLFTRYGDAELEQLREALAQGTLFYAHGKKVKELCARFAEMHGVAHCIPTTSCTASLHVAVAALNLEPGDEIITSPITDMGTVLGMLWCQLVPIFADVDLDTHLMDPASVEARITPRTRAILPVHMAGLPCDMVAMRAIADKHGLAIIEDCAQSYLAEFNGQKVGTFGDLSCFSINEYKHISCGDGGLILTNDDALASRCRLLMDKGYDRSGLLRIRATQFLAMNYRMTELQGAVALAQLDKLEGIVAHYRALYDRFHAAMQGVDGLCLPLETPGGRTSAWFYMMRIDEAKLGVTRDWFAEAVRAEGAPGGGYIPFPIYLNDIFANEDTLGTSHLPYSLPGVEIGNRYAEGTCPNAETLLKTCLNFSFGMAHTEELIDQYAAAYRKVAAYCLRQQTAV
jgi:perosamine synthetase